ncbi:MAG: N-acetyltransferase [Salinisphaera sp.]|nr:N-acetyltransferase [Salinisphaera sp.]
MPSDPVPAIRTAMPIDIDALLALERECFEVDAQSRNSLAYLLSRANADTYVIGDGEVILAYVMLLYRRNSRVARVYSIAVAATARGQGLAARLLIHAETSAGARGATIIRAEARQSNRGSRALFAAAGYREIGALPGYYAGGEDGVRLEKSLV